MAARLFELPWLRDIFQHTFHHASFWFGQGPRCLHPCTCPNASLGPTAVTCDLRHPEGHEFAGSRHGEARVTWGLVGRLKERMKECL